MIERDRAAGDGLETVRLLRLWAGLRRGNVAQLVRFDQRVEPLGAEIG